MDKNEIKNGKLTKCVNRLGKKGLLCIALAVATATLSGVLIWKATSTTFHGDAAVLLVSAGGYFNEYKNSNVFNEGENLNLIYVKKGTKLNDLPKEQLPNLGKDEDSSLLPCNWVDENGKLIGAEPIDVDNLLCFAQYFTNIADAKSYAVGEIGKSFFDAAARQPEAINKLKDSYANTLLYIEQTTSAYSAVGLRAGGKALMDACARQPEAISYITNCFSIFAKSINDCSTVLMPSALGEICASCLDSCARQPEIIRSFFSNVALIISKYAQKIPTIGAVAFRAAGSSMMEACAREPLYANDIFRSSLMFYEACIKITSIAQSASLGCAADEFFDACARQPAAIGDLSEMAMHIINEILYIK